MAAVAASRSSRATASVSSTMASMPSPTISIASPARRPIASAQSSASRHTVGTLGAALDVSPGLGTPAPWLLHAAIAPNATTDMKVTSQALLNMIRFLSLWSQRDIAVLDGQCDYVRFAARTQVLASARDMCASGLVAEKRFVRDLAGGVSLGGQRDDLDHARGRLAPGHRVLPHAHRPTSISR